MWDWKRFNSAGESVPAVSPSSSSIISLHEATLFVFADQGAKRRIPYLCSRT